MVMGLTNPLPVNLAAECRKAEKIFNSFADPVKGLDNVIPLQVLRNAKGFAIFTVVKAGFLFSARAGTGIVIARLDDGSWSAPSAIGTTGVGFGAQGGVEETSFIIVLNSRSAVKTFMSAGSISLGGNFSLAVGPLGRNAEGIGSLNSKGKVAAMYSYSKTRGLFGGVSIEGSVIVERSDANAKAYRADVTVKQLLTGQVDPPHFAEGLIECITRRGGSGLDSTWIDDAPSPMDSPGLASAGRNRGYSFGSPNSALGSSTNSNSGRSSPLFKPKLPSSFSFRKDKDSPKNSPRNPKTSNKDYFTANDDDLQATNTAVIQHQAEDNWRDGRQSFDLSDDDDGSYSNARRGRSGTLLANSSSQGFTNPPKVDPFADEGGYQPRHSLDSLNSASTASDSERDQFNFNGLEIRQKNVDLDQPKVDNRPPLPKRTSTFGGGDRVVALFDFSSSEPGDLPFAKDDVIQVIKRPAGEEWWLGQLRGREGIFPSNYVKPL